MHSLDWRQLFADNQAAIARSGLRTPTVASSAGPMPRARVTMHVPAALDPSEPAAAVCMLHGCTQDPAGFAAATAMNRAADRHGFVVIYPGQDRSRNAQGCWNWFAPEHQRRGAGEPAAIAAILRDAIATETRCTIDPARVFVAGLSAGGAMALVLAACYPDLVAAVAVHSGLAYRSAHDVASAFRVMRGAEMDGAATGEAMHAAMGPYARPMPALVIHGTADRTVDVANGRRVLRQAMDANHLAAPNQCAHDVTQPTTSSRVESPDGRSSVRSQWTGADGRLLHELIEIDGLGHAWSGGAPGGSFSDPAGPSATEAIWAFFAEAAASPVPRLAISESSSVRGERGHRGYRPRS